MADESVVVLIEGEDRASETLAKAANAVEQTAGRIKAATGKTKVTTEFIGSFASALGGSEIGSIASQFSGLNEKAGQLSDLLKGGGAGATAVKAGLAGVVAYASFNFGKTIGDALFATQKWKQELEFAKVELKELGDKSLELAKNRMSDDLAEIKLIEDPAQQEAELRKLFTAAGNNSAEYGKQLDAVQDKIKKLSNDNTFSGSLGSLFGEGDIGALGTIAQGTFWGGIEENIAELREREAALKSMKEAEESTLLAIQRYQGREREDAAIAKAKEEQKQLAELKAATAKSEEQTVQKLREALALEQAIGKEKFAVQASQMVTDEAKQAEIVSLLEQQDALQKMREAEKAAEQEQQAAAKAKEEQLNRINALRDSELQKLKEMEILQTQGQAAATSFNLQNQGLSKADADFIASEKERLSAKKEEKPKASTPGNLQAIQSRFLRAAPGGGDPAAVTAENSKKMVEHLSKLITIQERAGNMDNVDRLKGKLKEYEVIA